MYIFYFPVVVTNEKKNNEKKIGAESVGLLPNCIVKKKMYCKAEIVLQEIGEKAVEIVLQYNFCIVIKAVREVVLQYKLYCDM